VHREIPATFSTRKKRALSGNSIVTLSPTKATKSVSDKSALE